MVGAVDFTDAKRWLAFGTRNTHLALVIHAVGRVRLELVREDLAVTCDRSNGIETSDVPESAVLLVPGDRTPEAKVGVHRPLVATELVGMVIEFDDRIGADARTAHYAIFASLGRLSHRQPSSSDHRRTGDPRAARSPANAQRTFRAVTAPARCTGCRRPGPARVQFCRVCDRCGRARPGWRSRGPVSPCGGCGEGRAGAAPLHPLCRRGAFGPARRSPARAAAPGSRRRHRAVREGARPPLPLWF